MGEQLHGCLDLAWIRLRGLRDQRVCAADRELEGLADGAHELRARRAGAGAAGAASHGSQPDASIHHPDRGVQYVSLPYTERLAEAGIEPSVGSVGDRYDNALAKTINGLYKAEVIHRRSWRNRQDVELGTLDWVDRYNRKRVLGSIGSDQGVDQIPAATPTDVRRAGTARAGTGGKRHTQGRPHADWRRRSRPSPVAAPVAPLRKTQVGRPQTQHWRGLLRLPHLPDRRTVRPRKMTLGIAIRVVIAE